MEFMVRGSIAKGYSIFLHKGEGKKQKSGFVFRDSKITKFKTVTEAETVAKEIVAGKKGPYKFKLS